jgi:hypothetical protein
MLLPNLGRNPVYIEIEDPELFERVHGELTSQGIDHEIKGEDGDWDDEYVPETGKNVLSHYLPVSPSSNLDRWVDMRLAALGARTWTKEFSFSPTYAGSDPKEIRDIILDAKFAEGKATYVRSFGVNYLGRVNVDPRTIVLVDYKGDKTHNPHEDLAVAKLLAALPEDPRTQKTETSWTSFGIASTSNVEKLRDFLDYYEQTNIVAYSPGAKAKLRHLGRDFAEVPEPEASDRYGKLIRASASALRPWA